MAVSRDDEINSLVSVSAVLIELYRGHIDDKKSLSNKATIN